jgi:hypothetical protein
MVPTSPRHTLAVGQFAGLRFSGARAHAVRVCHRTSSRTEISTILPGAGGCRSMKNGWDRGGVNLGRPLRSVSGYRGGRAVVIGLPDESAGAGEDRSRRGSLANSGVLAGYRGGPLQYPMVAGSLGGRCPPLDVFLDQRHGPGEPDNCRALPLDVTQTRARRH